jgi:ElaB/YqjD/DUF883 family membrane-anchored ribosome-binding protein
MFDFGGSLTIGGFLTMRVAIESPAELNAETRHHVHWFRGNLRLPLTFKPRTLRGLGMALSPKTESSGAGTGATQRSSADLEADIRQLREDFAKLVEQLSTTGEHGYGAARRAALGGVDQLRSQGEAVIEELRSSAVDMEEQLKNTVREKPVTALAIAAGLGYFLALLSRR